MRLLYSLPPFFKPKSMFKNKIPKCIIPAVPFCILAKNHQVNCAKNCSMIQIWDIYVSCNIVHKYFIFKVKKERAAGDIWLDWDSVNPLTANTWHNKVE